MKNKIQIKNKDLIKDNKIFIYLAALTGIILSIPFLGMKFQLVKPDPNNPYDTGLNWTFIDFLIMGILIFGMGTLFILISRKVKKEKRIFVAIVILITFLLVWAHLAVGIIDTLPLAGS